MSARFAVLRFTREGRISAMDWHAGIPRVFPFSRISVYCSGEERREERWGVVASAESSFRD